MDIKQLERILLYSGNFILIMNIFLFIVGIKFRYQIQKNAVSWIWYCIILGLFLSIIELILIKYIIVREFIYFNQVYSFMTSLGISDFNFISPFSYLIKFIFLGLFFRDIFEAKRLRTFFQVLIFALVIFELIMVFDFKSYQGYDSISSTVKNIFLMLGSGLFLFKFYNKDNSNLQLPKNPYFWLGIGLFVPALSDLFLELIFSKLYLTDLAGFYKYYLYRNASQILGFLFLIKGFWQSKYLKFLPSKY